MTSHQQTVAQPTRGRRLRILYAEDLQDLRDLLRIVLGKEGHAVDAVEDGRRALVRLLADPAAYDLLITDHHMPGMNGLELVTELRQTPFAGKTVVFSSELSPAVSEAYRALAVDRLLNKPVSPAELRLVLAELFSDGG